MTDSKYSSRKFSSQGELNPFNSSNLQRSDVRDLRLAYPRGTPNLTLSI